MMSEKLKTRYSAMQKEIYAPEGLIQHTISTVHAKKLPRRVPRIRTAALVAAVFILLIAITLPVMASTETGRNLLYSIYPEIANVIFGNMVDDNEGIRLTVESVSVHDDTAEVYFSLRDLTGDRISETIEPLYNYYLDLNDDSYFGQIEPDCRFLRHDTKNGKNHYLTTIRNVDGTAITTGSRITLTLGQIVLGRYTVNTLNAGIDLSNLRTAPETDCMPIAYWTGTPTGTLRDKLNLNTDDSCEVLVPGTSLYNIVPDIDITAAGYKNGILRLQVCHSGTMGSRDLFGSAHGKGVLYLADQNDSDKLLYCASMATYFSQDSTKLYDEFFFDIPQEELENYDLALWYRPYTDVIEGKWQVTILADRIN